MKTRLPAWIGSAVLLLTAIFHASGYPQLARHARNAPGLNPRLAEAMHPLWLAPTVHWTLLALLAALAVRHPGRLARWVLLACALVALADAALLFAFLGPFLGEAMLALAGVLFGVAAFLQPRAAAG